jgi:hypothetical protein
MPSKDTSFGFGSKPCMKEVPPGATAVFTFRGLPELVETDYGEKYSFPITLISHPSYDTLPLDMDWQSKCQSAKQIWNILNSVDTSDFNKLAIKHYKETTWTLTRFDTGAYWLEINK